MSKKQSLDKTYMSKELRAAALKDVPTTAHSLRHKRYRKITAVIVAAVATACLLLVGLVWLNTTQPSNVTNTPPIVPPSISLAQPIQGTNPAYATVLLSLNPEIEFQVDANAMILSVTGKNEDGAALIDGIDFTGFSFENATIVVVNKLIENNYITVNSIDKNILLSVSGETGQMNLLEVMSATIQSAAERYELNIEPIQTGEQQLEIVLKKGEELDPDENALPDADPNNLPTYMEIEYELTGKVNTPEEIGWRDVEGGDRVFQHGYSEVSDVYLNIKNGGKFQASQIVDFDTASDWLHTATLQMIHSLIEKGYITNDMPGQVVLDINGCTQNQYQQTKELVSLMLMEARLKLEVQPVNEKDTLRIVPSKDAVINEPSVYSLSDLLNTRLNKELSDITKTQMKIMQLAFSPDGAEERLMLRYWAVVPNLMGLSEEEATYLCEVSGFIPVIVHDDFVEGESRVETIGKVIYQDGIAGFTSEAGMRMQINIQTDNTPSRLISTFILIHSNGQTVIPYEIPANSKILNYEKGTGFIYSEGVPLGDQLAQISDILPTVFFGNDFAWNSPFEITFSKMSIYNENYEQIDDNAELDRLKQLQRGLYYVGMVMLKHGIHDTVTNEREFVGVESCFKLIVE